MSNSFEDPDNGPDDGLHEGFGFGLFDPHSRRAMHHAQREARRAMRDLLKDQARVRIGIPGLGFGPALPVVNLAAGGAPPGGRRGRGRGRGRRGDVRAAILALLAERPMHGYEMIQEIGQRSDGLWQPSPGSVYPTLQLLVDEGLIVGTESEGNKRLFELTDEGRDAAAKAQTPPWEEIADDADPNEVNLRASFGQLTAAIFQGAYAATPEQHKRILEIIKNARRDIYGVLGEAD